MKVCVTAKVISGLILVIILSVSDITEAAVSCGPAEEGTEARVVCDSSFTSSLVWAILVGEDIGTVSGITCTTSTCTSSQPTRYSATVHSRSQGSTLTVTNFSRDLSTWLCGVDGGEGEQCSITAYVKPESPTCNSPSLVAGGSRVSVTCSTDRVFPQALCQFSSRVSSSNSWTLRQGNITYSHTSRSESSKEYFRSECTLEVAVRVLGPGTHTFRAVMYPDFAGSSPTPYGVTSGNSGVLTLSLPTVARDITCPQGSDVIDGYIKTGTQASCRCNIAHMSNPPGRVTWYTSSGQKVGTQATDGKSSVIDFVFSNPGSDYTCRADSPLGQGSPVTFQPNIAYGPTDVTITVNNNNLNFDLCPGRSLLVTCLVALGTVNPAPLFTVLQNNSRLADRQPGSADSSNYGYIHTLLSPTGGDLLVSCRADNSKFSDITTVVTALVKVREPPPAAPVITIAGQELSGTSQLWLTENETASVQCRVDGGVPVVSDVTVSCPSGLTKDLAEVTRSQDKTKCTCSATHVTNCYQKTSDVTVDVAYGPDSVTITRDKGTQPYNLCPGSDDEVITCSVPTSEVNPDPQFSAMVSPGQASAWGSGGGGAGPHAWTYQFKPVQGGLHRVRCLARNSRSQRQVTSRDLEFEVREPPPSKPRIVIENSHGETTLLEGDDVMIRCYVDGGFPLVTSSDMTLTCTSSDGMIKDTGENATISKPGVKMAVNGTQCTCIATHVSQCYQETTVETVFVQFLNSSQTGENSDIPAAAIGGGIAAAVILIVVIIGVYCILKRKGILDRFSKQKKEDSHNLSVSKGQAGHTGRKEPTAPWMDPSTVVIDNSALYGSPGPMEGTTHTEREPPVETVDNSALYGSAAGIKGRTNFHRQSAVEVVDNSALYDTSANLHDPDGKYTPQYRDYRDVPTSTTSATMAPKNLDQYNSKEDIRQPTHGSKKKPVPLPKHKPAVPAKPKVIHQSSTEEKMNGEADNGYPGDDLYSTVIEAETSNLAVQDVDSTYTTADQDSDFTYVNNGYIPDVKSKGGVYANTASSEQHAERGTDKGTRCNSQKLKYTTVEILPPLVRSKRAVRPRVCGRDEEERVLYAQLREPAYSSQAATHLHTHPPIYTPAHPLTHPPTLPSTHVHTHSPTYPRKRTPIHPLAHSPTPLHTRPPAHPPIYHTPTRCPHQPTTHLHTHPPTYKSPHPLTHPNTDSTLYYV